VPKQRRNLWPGLFSFPSLSLSLPKRSVGRQQARTPKSVTCRLGSCPLPFVLCIHTAEGSLNASFPVHHIFASHVFFLLFDISRLLHYVVYRTRLFYRLLVLTLVCGAGICTKGTFFVTAAIMDSPTDGLIGSTMGRWGPSTQRNNYIMGDWARGSVTLTLTPRIKNPDFFTKYGNWGGEGGRRRLREGKRARRTRLCSSFLLERHVVLLLSTHCVFAVWLDRFGWAITNRESCGVATPVSACFCNCPKVQKTV